MLRLDYREMLAYPLRRTPVLVGLSVWCFVSWWVLLLCYLWFVGIVSFAVYSRAAWMGAILAAATGSLAVVVQVAGIFLPVGYVVRASRASAAGERVPPGLANPAQLVQTTWLGFWTTLKATLACLPWLLLLPCLWIAAVSQLSDWTGAAAQVALVGAMCLLGALGLAVLVLLSGMIQMRIAITGQLWRSFWFPGLLRDIRKGWLDYLLSGLLASVLPWLLAGVTAAFPPLAILTVPFGFYGMMVAANAMGQYHRVYLTHLSPEAVEGCEH